MSDKDGGPAFPIPNATDMDGYVYAPEARGMSLRDYFAASALTGLLAGLSEAYREKLADGTYGGMVHAMAAYALADALLKARTQGES